MSALPPHLVHTLLRRITWTYKQKGGALWRNQLMAIHRLIANGSFGPDEIEAMTEAYDAALIELCQPNNDDPITELVAKSIVNVQTFY